MVLKISAIMTRADKRVSSGIRPNFVTTIEGENKNRFTWIITHMDIVPPGELRSGAMTLTRLT